MSYLSYPPSEQVHLGAALPSSAGTSCPGSLTDACAWVGLMFGHPHHSVPWQQCCLLVPGLLYLHLLQIADVTVSQAGHCFVTDHQPELCCLLEAVYWKWQKNHWLLSCCQLWRLAVPSETLTSAVCAANCTVAMLLQTAASPHPAEDAYQMEDASGI